MKKISRKEASLQGLPSYYTGMPCKNGHFSPRGVLGGNCYQCDYDRGKAKREKIKQQRDLARTENKLEN
jgi:hypothetical protein